MRSVERRISNGIKPLMRTVPEPCEWTLGCREDKRECENI